jgi:hypothetical protein
MYVISLLLKIMAKSWKGITVLLKINKIPGNSLLTICSGSVQTQSSSESVEKTKL